MWLSKILNQYHKLNSGNFFCDSIETNYKMGEQLKLRGMLSGHGGWITAIATTSEDSSMILTASRDKVS